MLYQDVINAATATIAKIWSAHSGRVGQRFWLTLQGDTCGIAPSGPTDFKGVYGWRLQMPALPLDAPMAAVDVDTFAAQVIHEISHPLFTCFQTWDAAVREGLGHLVNCLEDVRIERQAITVPVAVNAFELLAAHSDRQAAKVMSQGWDPADPQNLPYTFKAYGRQRLNGYPLPSLPALPAAIESQWGWVFAELAACQSTHDVLKLARKIAKRAGQKGQPGEGEGQKGQPGEGEGQKGQPGDGEGQKGQPGDGEGQKGQPGDGEGGDAPVNAPVDMESDGDGEGSGSGTSSGGSGQFREYDDSLTAQVEAILRRSRTPDFDAGVENELTALGRAAPIDFGELMANGSGSAKVSEIAAMIPNTAKLQADVRRLVKSPERVGVTRALTSGRFDRRGFTRAQAGAQNVFARRHYEPGVNAVVSLVLDASSSMDEKVRVGGVRKAGVKSRAAAALALAMGDALERARVPFEVCYAQSGHGATGPSAAVYSDPGRTSMVKGFNEPWTQRRERLGHAYCAGGTNNLGAAWGAAGRLLQVRDATRRLVFVLSDGDDAYTPKAWKRAAKILAKKGVEVVGVGLMHDVGHSFDVFLNVTDPAELAQKGLGLLVRQLERAAG